MNKFIQWMRHWVPALLPSNPLRPSSSDTPNAPHALDALSGLLPQLRQYANWAGRFGELTEKEFMRFVNTMHLLSQQLDTTSAKLQKLDRTLRGADENQAIAYSCQLFGKAGGHVQSCLELGKATMNSLQGLMRAIDKCEKLRGELKQRVVLFGLIETGFRLEMAHLRNRDDSEALNLNVTILHLRELQNRLAQTSAHAFDNLKKTGENLSGHLAEYEMHSRRMSMGLQMSKEVIQKELDEIRRILEPAGGIAARAADEMLKALESVKTIVVSVQFQDIVRQQLEHVSSGFKDIVFHLDPGAGQEEKGRLNAAARLALVHRIARIQLGQILAAQKEVDRAVDSIVGSLEILYATQKSLLRDSKDLNGIALDALKSFRTRELFEKEIRGLNASGAACAQLHGKLGRMLNTLDAFINEFSRVISNFGYDVKLAVINTQIGSAHVQKDGPLEKLACETDRNASAFTMLTGNLTANIQAELPPLRGLQERTKEFLEMSEREQSNLETEVVEAARRISLMLESIGQQSNYAGGDFEKLQDQLSEMGSNLEFLGEVRRQFTEAVSHCEQIIAITSGFAGAGGMEAERSLNQLKYIYTMETERQIHDKAAQGGGAMAPACVASSEGKDSGAASADESNYTAFSDDANPAGAGGDDIVLFETDEAQEPGKRELSGNDAASGSDAPACAPKASEPSDPKDKQNAQNAQDANPHGNSSEFGDGIELF